MGVTFENRHSTKHTGTITTLMTHKDSRTRSERTMRAIQRVGQAVSLAVDRFVSVGEAIAEDNPDIKVEMYEACNEAREAGAGIERVCGTVFEIDSLAAATIDDNTSSEMNHTGASHTPSPAGILRSTTTGTTTASKSDRQMMVRAARALLCSVTRVLLLADMVVVKQLLTAKDKVSAGLTRLESVQNFTEFVRAFSQFGSEMVDFAHLSGDRQTDLKDDRRRAQIAAARQILERSTLMLLTASKTTLRHPECATARENRDTVFCLMRRSMDLIHFVVKDGILDSASTTGLDTLHAEPDNNSLHTSSNRRPDDWDANYTACNAIRQFEGQVEMTRMTLAGPKYRDRLHSALNSISERTQDFTDSAYTTHEQRENILLLCDRARLELNQLMRVGLTVDQSERQSPTDELEAAILKTLRACKDLRQQLQQTALYQMDGFMRMDTGELLVALKHAAVAGDLPRLSEYSDRFTDTIEHVQEICRIVRQVAPSEPLQVTSKHCELNIQTLGPQVISAAQTLYAYPQSKIAKENLDVFLDSWVHLTKDALIVVKDVGEILQQNYRHTERQGYMSLPRPGKHGTTPKPVEPAKLDNEEQAKIAKQGEEMQMMTSELEAQTEKWSDIEGNPEHNDNDIVKRAKAMSAMAVEMYQFTRGEGSLKTTQDLFTQSELFVEEANRMYKVVRTFSYQVPAGDDKKELLENLDNVPTYVQHLQFTVKSSTVGKAATFTKVDNVISETKNLVNVITKVVTMCFYCATKHNLTFRGTYTRAGSDYSSDSSLGLPGDPRANVGSSSEVQGA